MKNPILLTMIASLALPINAFAGVPAPLPLAGVAGPVGLGAAAIAYCGYRLYKHKR